MKHPAFLVAAFTALAITPLAMPVLTPSLSAALPPVYQSTREYRALIDSPKLTEILGSAEPIISINREDNGFMVKTKNHSLVVDVVYEPMDHPGPAKFHLQFHSLKNAE